MTRYTIIATVETDGKKYNLKLSTKKNNERYLLHPAQTWSSPTTVANELYAKIYTILPAPKF